MRSPWSCFTMLHIQLIIRSWSRLFTLIYDPLMLFTIICHHFFSKFNTTMSLKFRIKELIDWVFLSCRSLIVKHQAMCVRCLKQSTVNCTETISSDVRRIREVALLIRDLDGEPEQRMNWIEAQEEFQVNANRGSASENGRTRFLTWGKTLLNRKGKIVAGD